MDLVFLASAVSLDVLANIVLKYSDGFRRKGLGFLALACIMAAFACLAQAVQTIELSVAYALWGAAGLCLTAATDFILFGQRLNLVGWLGLGLMIWGIVILHRLN
ncbi:multidrug/spermidine efflux SMR transporter subunit MdtI [Azotosporobacter soli]|uniref:multidrug/spermidine efflux SMR transporter subunit MdtI n=1 Tax=Azotosporobacter soli TaxID=3055040 RepID=UPI0031FEC380